MILIFVASNDKSKIDWKSLTEEKKRELYTEFVLHYLPKELGDAAVGNPITFLIMIIVGAVIAKASAVIAACASLIGTGFSAVNIIEGCKMITKVAEGYDSISDVNAAKVSAKDCARGIALLGVEIIPVLFGLIKRGFAKYNGKKIKVGETSSNSKKTIKFVNGQITGEITNALKTEPGTAFFWSGCAKVDPSTGKLLVSGDEVAAEIASKSGGTTLETQIKINNIEMPKWDFDVPESIKAWEDTSAAYAKQVSGDVRAIVGKKLRPENIWENVELPRLMQNPNVSKITTIDPDTMAETVIFERKAGTVYGKPNETLVKNGEWDKIIDNLEKNGNKIDDEVKKANLLDKNGEFSDVKIESDYQKYIKRKKQKGETPRDRLDWKEQSDYWRNESPIARGNNYNKIVRNSNIYPYHEIHLENGKRLDSYDMLAGEIISRKATDLDKISEDTFRKYLSEFKEKYSKGTKIRSNTYPQLDGMELNGQYILEIPATNAMLSDIDYYKKIAEEYDVILRFTEEIKCLN